MNPFDISWEAPEFEYRPKTANWYWITVIVAVIVLAAAVWQRNFLFSVFIIAAEILILVWSSKEPETIPFRFTEKGLTIRNRVFYPISDFSEWSVESDELVPFATLALRFHRRFRPLLHVQIPRGRVPELEEHLGRVLSLVPWDESFIDTLEKFFRF